MEKMTSLVGEIPVQRPGSEFIHSYIHVLRIQGTILVHCKMFISFLRMVGFGKNNSGIVLVYKAIHSACVKVHGQDILCNC